MKTSRERGSAIRERGRESEEERALRRRALKRRALRRSEGKGARIPSDPIVANRESAGEVERELKKLRGKGARKRERDS